MAIPIQQARGIFTQATLAKYKESIKAPTFLSSFFKVKTTTAKYISIEVQRGTEKIAVDVLRGTSGNRNMFSKSTEKQYMPPFYNENFDATALDFYDLLFGENLNPTRSVIGGLAAGVAEKLGELRLKIERAKELMASQVLETGVVTLVNGDDIDFKRKATSMKDNSGTPWSTVTTDIESHLIAAGDFLRTYGKNTSKVLNMIVSGTVLVDLKKSDYFQDNANFQQVRLVDVNLPQADSRGAAYHGRIAAGAYLVNIWSYDEMYTNASGTATRYTDAKKVIILPSEGTQFYFSHAGVPAIIVDKSNAEFPAYIKQVANEYVINNYIDNQRKSHTFELMSAPLPVPVTVDMMYTMKVLA